jgi:hypothetical protein
MRPRDGTSLPGLLPAGEAQAAAAGVACLLYWMYKSKCTFCGIADNFPFRMKHPEGALKEITEYLEGGAEYLVCVDSALPKAHLHKTIPPLSDYLRERGWRKAFFFEMRVDVGREDLETVAKPCSLAYCAAEASIIGRTTSFMGMIQSLTGIHCSPSHSWMRIGWVPSWSAQESLSGGVRPAMPSSSRRASNELLVCLLGGRWGVDKRRGSDRQHCDCGCNLREFHSGPPEGMHGRRSLACRRVPFSVYSIVVV